LRGLSAALLVVPSAFLLISGASAYAGEADGAAVYTKQEVAIIQKASNDLTIRTNERLDAIVRNQTVHLMKDLRQQANARVLLREKIAKRVDADRHARDQPRNQTAVARR
jgi:hypothetical protein